MLKEIHEQPRAITDTFRGRIAPETGNVVLPDVNLDPATVKALQRVVFVACGTAFHAAMLGRAMIERLAGLSAQDRKSTRLNSSHSQISYAVFCLKKKKML